VFSATTRVDGYGVRPYFFNPVLAACQLVHVAADEASAPALWDAEEDMRLFAPELAAPGGGPLPADKRRRWCDTPANLADRFITPEHVFTLHIYQHLINFSDYKLSVAGLTLDILPVLNGQPLQLTLKDVSSGGYAFSMLVWHERIVRAAHGGGQEGEEEGDEQQQRDDGAQQGGGGGMAGRLGRARDTLKNYFK
jgi:hypothetical protein